MKDKDGYTIGKIKCPNKKCGDTWTIILEIGIRKCPSCGVTMKNIYSKKKRQLKKNHLTRLKEVWKGGVVKIDTSKVKHRVVGGFN